MPTELDDGEVSIVSLSFGRCAARLGASTLEATSGPPPWRMINRAVPRHGLQRHDCSAHGNAWRLHPSAHGNAWRLHPLVPL